MRRTARRLAGLALAAVALSGCGQSVSDEPTGAELGDPPNAPPAVTPGELPPAEEDTAWYDDVELAAAEADVDTVWLAGWFPPEALEAPGVADMEVRYRKAFGVSPDPSAHEVAAAAFAALEGQGPVDLLHPLEGVPLRLLGQRVEDRGDGRRTLVLDFDPGIAGTNQLGEETGRAAKAQLLAMARHYFPEADQLLVTVQGRSAPELFAAGPWAEPVPLTG